MREFYIVERKYDGQWLRVGFKWWHKEDAVADAAKRMHNLLGTQFRVRGPFEYDGDIHSKLLKPAKGLMELTP